MCELGCAGRGHVLWEVISGDLGTGKGQRMDQGVVQKLVLFLEGRQDSLLTYNFDKLKILQKNKEET